MAALQDNARMAEDSKACGRTAFIWMLTVISSWQW
jgi:hypothetical protein